MGATLLPEILDQTDRVGAKQPIFALFARSNSAVTSSEKVQLTLIGSLLRAFQRTQDIVRCHKPPEGGSKTQSVQNLNNKLRNLWRYTNAVIIIIIIIRQSWIPFSV